MSKPLLGGAKATSAIIKPGKYKPKKFQMDMPDEKQSGIYGLVKGPIGTSGINGGFHDDGDDMVESMALDDNSSARPRGTLNPTISQSTLAGKISV